MFTKIFNGLIIIILAIIIIYLIFKRARDKKAEKFEKRDN
jgi:flagellar biogenesis protein FliO